VSTNVVFNGVTYSIPAEGDSNWGTNVSNYLIALASGTLSKSAGLFTLTAELDFGATYGLKTAYVKSRATNPAGTGVFRLGNTQSVSWRNAGNSADLALTVNASDELTFNGTKIGLSGSITNSDIAAGAAIALSKLAAVTASRVLVSDASGFVSASSVTTTTLGYLDATSSIQTQLNGKEPTITTLSIAKGGTNSGTSLNNNRVMQSSSGAIVEAAAITAARVLISDANGIPTHSTITTTTLSYLDATSSIQTQLNAKEGTITNLPINKGGTNSTTALNNNRIMQSSGGAIVEAAAITAARVLISDANGIPTHSTITSTTLGYLDATSSVQTQLNAKEPTISAGTTAQYWRGDKSWQTLDKSAVGLSNVDNTSDATKNAAAAQLTNKDYEGGTASNTSRLTVPKNTKTNLDALTRKEATLVYGSDTDKLYVDDGTTLVEVGSGSGGSINFITNGNGSAGTVGWTEGSYTAAAKPSGSFTASSGSGKFAIGSTSTTPVGPGTSSLTFTKSSGANYQGRAIEYSFALGLGYRAKVLQINIQYIINSGTFVGGFNSTNSSLIWYCAFSNDNGSTYTVSEPSTFKMFSNSSTISADFAANIQTPYDATNMKLIAYVSETATTAWEVEAVVGVSPSQYVYGTPITDWSYVGTNTITATTTSPTKGTILTDKVYKRRVGDSLELNCEYSQSSIGTAGSGTYLYSLPSGLSFDSSVITYTGAIANPQASTLTCIGDGWATVNSASGANAGLKLFAYDATRFYTQIFSSQLSSGTGDASVNDQIASGTYPMSDANHGFRFSLKAKILGWSSCVQMSDQTTQQVVAASFSGTTASSTALTQVTLTKIVDTTGTTSGNTWVVPVQGNYSISASATISTGSATLNDRALHIYIDGSTNVSNSETNSYFSNMTTATIVSLNAGQVISFYAQSATVSGSVTIFRATIQRLAGPSSIAATDTVAASYWLSANFAASTTVPINFDSKEFDYQGSVTTSATAWKFTAPIAGLYQITFFANCGTVAADIYIYKNGSNYKNIAFDSGSNAVASGATGIRLLAGEYIDFRPSSSITINGGTLSAVGSAVSIIKAGNY
jgi:hypothetical protein